MAKRYYWLKLQEGFFHSKRIKKLRKIAGGDTYTIIYLKMQLLALKTDGILTYTGLENSFAEELALDLDEDAANVAVTINYLLSCGLMETSDDIEFFLPYVEENTGSEGSSAKRMRDKRKRDEIAEASHCDGEKEKEIELEIEKELEIENISSSFCRDIETIVSYLNLRAGSAYKTTTRKTRELIRARMNEGFTVDDFRTVIDNKVAEWGKPPRSGEKDMRKYLRPETLFGTKFESYLNEKKVVSNDGRQEHEWVGGHYI